MIDAMNEPEETTAEEAVRQALDEARANTQAVIRVVEAIDKASTVSEAVQMTLDTVRSAFGWDYASFWRLDAEENALRFSTQSGSVSPEFQRVTMEARFREGEGLSGTFGNPRYTDPRVMALNSTIANTNIVWHGGKLLALEEAHAPFSLDAASLMPVNGGYETYGDKLCGPFTAHPKMDPKTGEMTAMSGAWGLPPS